MKSFMKRASRPTNSPNILTRLLCVFMAAVIGLSPLAARAQSDPRAASGLAVAGKTKSDLGFYPHRLLNVGTRAGINGAGQSNGTNLQFNTVSNFYIPIGARGLRLLYQNYYVSQGAAEADQSADITLKVGARPAGAAPGKTQPDAPSIGTSRRVTWGGAVSTTLLGSGSAVVGSTNALSDPLPFYFPGNTILSVQTYATLTSGQYWRGRGVVSGTGERNEEGVTVTDRSISGGASGTASWSIGPNLIVGIPDNPLARAVAIIGDSIATDTGDTASSSTGVAGYIERGLGIDVPNAKFTRGGEKLANWITRSYSQINDSVTYHTDAIIELGINDVGTPDTLATMQANLGAIVAKLRSQGLRVYVCTLTPWTTSTDSWATTANQTVTANEAVRVGYNDWVRTMPIGIAGVIEAADIAETARNSGKWKVTGAANYATADGVHPSAAMHLLMSASVTPSMFGYPLPIVAANDNIQMASNDNEAFEAELIAALRRRLAA
jgi:lysophospholipase L1-like esterase